MGLVPVFVTIMAEDWIFLNCLREPNVGKLASRRDENCGSDGWTTRINWSNADTLFDAGTLLDASASKDLGRTEIDATAASACITCLRVGLFMGSVLFKGFCESSL